MAGMSPRAFIDSVIQDFQNPHPSSEAAKDPQLCRTVIHKLDTLKGRLTAVLAPGQMDKPTVIDPADNIALVVNHFLEGAQIDGCVLRIKSLVEE